MNKIVAILGFVAILIGFITFLVIYKDGDLVKYAFNRLDKRWTFQRRMEEAVNGVSYCQWLVGSSYEYGNYVNQDYNEAVRWYRYSAEQGDPDGQRLLAKCLLQGRGSPKKEIEALMWLTIVASNSRGAYSGIEDSKYRESIAAKLSAQKIKAAEELAYNWRPKTWSQLKDF